MGYHSLKLYEKSLYVTAFACHFGRYTYPRLLLWPASDGDIFQSKIYKIFKELLNVFGITDGILVVGYDDTWTDNEGTVPRGL